MEMNPDRGCWVCSYCDSEWAPQTNIEGIRVLEASEFNCPLCAASLFKARLLDYGVLHCQPCGGVLIPMGDLVPLTDELRASRNAPAYVGRPPDPKSLDRHIQCPECHQTMDTHPYYGPGNVVIDTCESCEVHWLDRGELRRIAFAPDHHYSA